MFIPVPSCLWGGEYVRKFLFTKNGGFPRCLKIQANNRDSTRQKTQIFVVGAIFQLRSCQSPSNRETVLSVSVAVNGGT